MNVVVERGPRFVRVTPPCEEILSEALSYWRRVRAPGGSMSFSKVSCCKVKNDSLYAPEGLTARICSLLKNFELKYLDRRTKVLPAPNFNLLDPLREGQEDMIAAISIGDGGIIEAPTGGGKSHIIKQICKMWPGARIIICCHSREIIRSIYRDLLEIFSSDDVGMVGAGGRHERRITCAVDKSLALCSLDKCDLFISDEVHRAVSPGNLKVLSNLEHARKFGFSATPAGRGDGADMEIECFFGPRICTQTYQQVQRTGAIVPIEVLTFEAGHLPPINFDDMVRLERWAIWRNKERNKLIAESLRWLRKELGDEDPQILIMVKTVDHAVHLGTLLPDFQLMYAGMDSAKRKSWVDKGMLDPAVHPLSSERRREMFDEFRAGTLKRIISTPCWSTGVDFPGLNVLVRADAQSSPIANVQIPGRVSRSANGKKVGFMLDYNDAFNRVLGARYLKRAAIYRRKGWKTVDLDLRQLSRLTNILSSD